MGSYFTAKRLALLDHFGRVAVAGAASFALAYLASGGLNDWVSTRNAAVAAAVLTPILSTLIKAVKERDSGA